jgi:hypothetical protein
MAEAGRDVASGLIDVSGSLLADLAQIDSTLLDAALTRLLPPSSDSDDRPCGGTVSRLWQNY